MADDVVLPGTGATVAADDIGGIHHQRVKVGFGADGSYSDVSQVNGLPSSQGVKYVSGTGGALNADLVNFDTSGYTWFSFGVTGTLVGTITFQWSHDNVTWSNYNSNLAFFDVAVTGTQTAISSFPRYGYGSFYFRYFRARITAYTSGSAQIDMMLTKQNTQHLGGVLYTRGTVNVNSPSGVNSMSDAKTNTAVAEFHVGAMGLVFNGTTWDRVRNVTAVDGLGSTGLPAAGMIAYDAVAAVNRRVRSDGNGHVYAVNQPPTAGTGWTPSSNTALSNTKTQVKASAGSVGGWMLYNPNASVVYIQVWDVANGSITVGTTAPTYVLAIPAGSAANLELACGIAHSTAINIAATTTATGSTAPGTAVLATIFYK